MSTPKLFEMDFDKAFSAEVKRLGNLATQGSYAMLRGEAPDRLIVCFYGKEVQSRSCFEYPVQNEFTVFANAKDILDLLKSFPEGKLSVRDSMLTVISYSPNRNRYRRPSLPIRISGASSLIESGDSAVITRGWRRYSSVPSPV